MRNIKIFVIHLQKMDLLVSANSSSFQSTTQNGQRISTTIITVIVRWRVWTSWVERTREVTIGLDAKRCRHVAKSVGVRLIPTKFGVDEKHLRTHSKICEKIQVLSHQNMEKDLKEQCTCPTTAGKFTGQRQDAADSPRNSKLPKRAKIVLQLSNSYKFLDINYSFKVLNALQSIRSY